MFRIRSLLAGFVALLVTPMAVTPVMAEPIVVFAAASLREALDEAVAGYPQEVVVSYAGSGVIARQVAHGAPADVVILANATWMEWLISNGTVVADQRQDFLGNRLVVIAPPGADAADTTPDTLLAGLAGGRLALGQVSSVPAGIYAKQWMQNSGIWTDLAPHLAEVDNVRAALRLVALGESPLGIVYATDARVGAARVGAVQVVHAIDPTLHDDIRYSMAVIHSRNSAQNTEFTRYLMGEGRSAFLRHGFLRPVEK